jgi:hypothetical protein
MSLALGPQKGKMTYVYAGVNSSPASIAKGKNEHLRAVAIEQSPSSSSTSTSHGRSSSASSTAASAKPAVAKLAEVTRTAMFTDPDEGTYQRLVRVTGGGTATGTGTVIGAAATAMGKAAQLAVFEAANPALPKVRGVLDLPSEAEDLDILQTGEGEYQVAYCYKYELHVVDVGKSAASQAEPRLVYTMPEENSERPAFRSIRYLSPGFILAISNRPKRNGVIIQALRLPSPTVAASADEKERNARVAATTKIPRQISATALAVTNLSPVPTTSSPSSSSSSSQAPIAAGGRTPDTQYLIAVAGNDSSISLYSLEQISTGSLTLLVDLHPFHTIKEAHGAGNITGLAFSTFVVPKTHLRPQFIRLASISLQKTVAVHSIPLRRHVDRTPRNKKGPPRPARYVVGLKSHGPSNVPLATTLGVIVIIMGIIGQAILEIYGGSPPILHAHRFLPSWHGTLRSADHQPPYFADQKQQQDVSDFIAKLSPNVEPQAGEKLVLFEAEHLPPAAGDDKDADGSARRIHVNVHQEDVHGEAREWHELPEEQKQIWREKLDEAGTWTRDMGEGVLKGILFGQLADAVGNIVGG